MNMQLRLARTWGFHKLERPAGPPTPGAAPGGPGLPPPPPGVAVPTKYNVTLSVTALNPLNHPSFGNPNGNLSSPLFGQSLNMQNFFFPGNATYNRKITMQVQVGF
jgi:hypothetical protein